MPKLSLADHLRLTALDLADVAVRQFSPSLRLGVTGLSRAGKTVFITALVHAFLKGARMPLFEPLSGGRIAGTHLAPQPDDDIPRFAYEAHLKDLIEERIWPQSTRLISELRLTVMYESASFLNRTLGPGTLDIDIVDYPGEWLLDLPLLDQNYAAFARKAIEGARAPIRAAAAGPFLAALSSLTDTTPADEALAASLAGTFGAYLKACRADEHGLSMLPPGRFLMPGDLEGSPALTFAPIDALESPLGRLMAARFEAYKRIVAKPFFIHHFARLDRQIVLVDVLSAINAGPHAVADLETALSAILACFRTGGGLSRYLPSRRIDKILLAASKADHVHESDHDRLEAILKRLSERAVTRSRLEGVKVEALALAAIRATRQASLKQDGETFPAIAGVPLADEVIDGQTFDGKREIAIFPGDLPRNPDRLFDEGRPADPIRFLRFRPPALQATGDGLSVHIPHIRLDRALSFLLSDRLS